jgi:hypothetical protein
LELVEREKVVDGGMRRRSDCGDGGRATCRAVAVTASILSALALVAAGSALASDGSVGPGEVHTVLVKRGYRIAVSITPNLGGRIPSTFTLECTRSGDPVTATITARFTMVAMHMPPLGLRLRPVAAGVYRATGEMLVMPGRWLIRFHVSPRDDRVFDVLLADSATVDAA